MPDAEEAAPKRSVRRPRQRGDLVASLNRHVPGLVRLCFYRPDSTESHEYVGLLRMAVCSRAWKGQKRARGAGSSEAESIDSEGDTGSEHRINHTDGCVRDDGSAEKITDSAGDGAGVGTDSSSSHADGNHEEDAAGVSNDGDSDDGRNDDGIIVDIGPDL